MAEPECDRASVKCSRCGSADRLNFVIIPHEEEGLGRVLVHCYRCRRSGYGKEIDVSIPLLLMTSELMAACYAHRLTESDPDRAARIVFGEGPEASEAVRLIEAAIATLEVESLPS